MGLLKRWKGRTLLFLAVVGPGIITANVDNDAGGILTYSQAGAQYGFLLLWTMIPITLALIVVQEMSARMGAVTGKGLSDLIREEFGLRITFLMMLGILITNFGNVVTEFIGIATSLELFGLSRYVTVPVCGVIVWLIVVRAWKKSSSLHPSSISPTFLQGRWHTRNGRTQRSRPSSRLCCMPSAIRHTCLW